MSSPFTNAIGVSQGRIATSDAPDGSYVFELGHQAFGDVRLAVGDRHEVYQSLVRSPESYFFTCRVRVRTPDDWVGTERYQLTMRLNGTPFYTRTIKRTDRDIDIQDIGVSLVGAIPPPMTNSIAVRLERTA